VPVSPPFTAVNAKIPHRILFLTGVSQLFLGIA
jgi:hypothetical protein